MKLTSMRGAWIAALTALLILPSAPAVAQGGPTAGKMLKIVVGFGAGGAMDLTARVIGNKLAQNIGVPVVVENRTGAGGTMATESIVKSTPDGTILLLGGTDTAISPSLYPNLVHDPVKDLTPISRVARTVSVLLTSPNFPANNLAEFIALAKAKPGKLSYSSSGIGSFSQLATELLASQSGAKFLHVPYKSSPDQISAVLSGVVDFSFVVLSQAVPNIVSKKAKALAVSSAQRVPQLPDVPSVAEAGYPGYELVQWYALFAPPGVPQATVTQLNSEIVKALNAPEVVKQLSDNGLAAAPSTPDELGGILKSEVARFSTMIKSAGVKSE